MATPNDWSEADAVALRAFITQNPRFLEILKSRIPKVSGTTMQERAMTGSEVKGFFDCIDAIESLQKDKVFSNEDAGYMDGKE